MLNKIKNFLIEFRKLLIALGLISVVSAAVILNPTTPIEQPIGAIPCIEDSTKSINDRIINCPIVGKERANLKGREIAKLNFVKYTDLTTGITVEIKDGKINQFDGGIEFYARAWKGAQQLGFGTDGTVEWERFKIHNPPILVNDPNGTIIREWTEKVKPNDTVEVVRQLKLREDPMAAIRSDLAHTIKVGNGRISNNIVSGKIGSTHTTYRPDANPESTSVDGWVARNAQNESWTTLVNSAGISANDIVGTDGLIAGTVPAATNGNWERIYRSPILFDTSDIGTDTISSSTLSVFGSARIDVGGITPSTNIYTSNPTTNTALVAGDYNIARWGSTAQSDVNIIYADWKVSTTVSNDFDLNATGRGNIVKDGITKFGMRNANYDVPDIAPAWNASEDYHIVRGYAADTAGTTNDPKLVVVHSAAAEAATPVVSPIILFE